MNPSSAIFFRSCNFCGGETFRRFRSLGIPFPSQLYGSASLSCSSVGERLKLEYLECTNCGLVGINPLTFFSDINQRSFDREIDLVAWSGFDYESYETGKVDLTRYHNSYFSVERFRRSNRILDVSCGPGVTLNWFASEKKWNVFGVDPDRHSVRMARERYGISITNGLIDDVLEPDESFDIVWMDNSLEHAFDPLGTLLTAYRKLRKGGALAIFVPNSEALTVKHLDLHMYWGHWFLYCPLTLFRMLTRIGFSVAKLHAAQTDISLELRRLVDVDAVSPAFNVIVPGANAIERVLESTPCYADFFSMLAVKPENGAAISPHESELREIAQKSLMQRSGLDVPLESESPTKVPKPAAVGIESLDYRLIRESDAPSSDAKVYFVKDGTRRWVLSRDWLDARGYCFPDDVTPIQPGLFAQLLEGPPITG